MTTLSFAYSHANIEYAVGLRDIVCAPKDKLSNLLFAYQGEQTSEALSILEVFQLNRWYLDDQFAARECAS